MLVWTFSCIFAANNNWSGFFAPDIDDDTNTDCCLGVEYEFHHLAELGRVDEEFLEPLKKRSGDPLSIFFECESSPFFERESSLVEGLCLDWLAPNW